MKRFLCVILALVCVLALSSCNLLEEFMSFDKVENGTPTAQDQTSPEATVPEESTPEATTPEVTSPEITTPEITTPEITTPEITTPEITTPEITTPEITTPEITTPEITTPEITTPENPPAEDMITVSIVFQSGGVHRIEDAVTLPKPATLEHAFSIFVERHTEMVSFYFLCYLNDKQIDPGEKIFLNDGDRIYLQEQWEGGGGSHIHLWDELGCRICGIECSHEWEEGVCKNCGFTCLHLEWMNAQCVKCGIFCQHSEWDDNRQCIVCHEFLGVDLLQLEIYEDGEYKYNANGSIETTMQNLLMAYYGYYPWEYLVSNYIFYFNGTLVTDGSYMITEDGRIDLVTRNGEGGGNIPDNPETPDVTYNMSFSIINENGERFQGDYQFSEPKELAYLLSEAGYYIDFGMGYRVTVNGEVIEDSYSKGAYFLMIDQSCIVTVEPTIKILVNGYDELFYATESEDLCFEDVAKYYGFDFDKYFWCYMENEILAGDEKVAKLHHGDYNYIHEIKLHERNIIIHIEVIDASGFATTYCNPELYFYHGIILQDVMDAYGIPGYDYTWEMIDVKNGYVSTPIDPTFVFEVDFIGEPSYVCENNATYLLTATSIYFAPDGSTGWN